MARMPHDAPDQRGTPALGANRLVPWPIAPSTGSARPGVTRGRGKRERRFARLAVRAAVLLAVVLLGPVLGVGCNEQTRYQVLSFFFDGVPAPGAATQPAAGQTGGSGAGVTLAGTGNPSNEPAYFEHTPYRTRQCNGCHAAGGMAVAVTAQGAMCGKCHGEYIRPSAPAWLHGPVAVGECGLCHVPHRSLVAGLLKKPVPDLCLDCHNMLGIPDRPYHKPGSAGQRPCTDCHDPHMAGNRLLLNDARALARRKHGQGVVSSHKPFEDHKCTLCHVAGQQNKVVEKIDTVCLGCHAKMAKEVVAAPNTLHEAVRTGHCINCHSPHTSSRPHLVRTTGEKMCLSCHKLSDIAKPNHPQTASADCSICHAGHTSDRPHLLRPGVPGSAEGMGWRPPWWPPGRETRQGP